jgi:Fe-Mn family superoxide dismutase
MIISDMFKLPELPYKYDVLEPFIDAKTMEIHHTKHHQTYVDKLNALVDVNPELKDKTLEELCLIPETKNMAGGHFNHSFFWPTLAPATGEVTSPSFAPFKEEFASKALSLFGSGWVWLANKDGKNEVIGTPLQDSPLVTGYTPILGIDLWEHAYYLKFQNRRVEYIEAFWNIVNWKTVEENFKKYQR